MNIQALSPKVAGLFGYGVMLVDGYEQELSSVEREKENRIRYNQSKPKRVGLTKVELKTNELLKHMPDTFTTEDLKNKNKELQIFNTVNVSYISAYFNGAYTVKRFREKSTRKLITTFTKINQE